MNLAIVTGAHESELLDTRLDTDHENSHENKTTKILVW